MVSLFYAFFEEKLEKRRKSPNPKLKGNKRVGGKVVKSEEIPQPEANKKQASWGKSRKIGEIPQPEAIKKQAGWGKSCKIGGIPQPGAKGKQAGWGKSWETSHKALVGFGRGEDSGAFVYHAQLSVWDDGFCAGTFATVGT